MDQATTFFNQINITHIWIGVVVICTALIIYLFLSNESKEERINSLQDDQDKLMRSFNDLDEQAKLIVRTDLELNKAQEELERRLNGLNILQRTSREISRTMDQEEIFKKLNQKVFNDLGFGKVLIVGYDKELSPKELLNIDINSAVVEKVSQTLNQEDPIFRALQDGHVFTSIKSSQKNKTKIIQLFDAEHFILAPILANNGLIALIFVGNRYDAPAVTEGDEELISILAGQIGQALDNATLFEQAFRSSQMLETKVKERTKQLTQAVKEVEESNRKKSEFISAVSHELRTPLTSIKGYASILMTGKVGDIPTAVKDRLGKINTHSDNLVKLINDLLDISRIESGRVDMKVQQQSIIPMIDGVGDLLAPQLRDKGVNFRNNVSKDIPEVFVDAQQAERVFINLISNAIKFTPKDGIITVDAKHDLDSHQIIFNVSDSGIGISEEDQARLFDEFYRVDNEINMSVKGTGLGLALAKNIVEAHGGRMGVHSKIGLGTTFHFGFSTRPPLKKEEDESTKE